MKYADHLLNGEYETFLFLYFCDYILDVRFVEPTKRKKVLVPRKVSLLYNKQPLGGAHRMIF